MPVRRKQLTAITDVPKRRTVPSGFLKPSFTSATSRTYTGEPPIARDDRVGHLLGIAEAAHRANDPAALALPKIAAGNVDVLLGQCAADDRRSSIAARRAAPGLTITCSSSSRPPKTLACETPRTFSSRASTTSSVKRR